MDLSNYERIVNHCNPSQNVKTVTIASVESAKNSDRLDIIKFEECAWQVLVSKGNKQMGQKVLFIPPNSILPTDLAQELGVAQYLSKGRVRVARLRGNRSEGFVVDPEEVKGRVKEILHWEDLPPSQMCASWQLPKEDISPRFEVFYKIPSLKNEPYTFDVGERVAYSEKIHGTNVRFGMLNHPTTGERILYIGTHQTVINHGEEKTGDENIYVKLVRGIAHKIVDIEPEIVFYGEIYGYGIQHLTYGLREKKLRVFAMTVNGEYVSSEEVMTRCDVLGLDRVTFHFDTFTGIEQYKLIADLPSELTDNHVREGIVLVSQITPKKMAKIVGFNYLLGRGKTERH